MPSLLSAKLGVVGNAPSLRGQTTSPYRAQYINPKMVEALDIDTGCSRSASLIFRFGFFTCFLGGCTDWQPIEIKSKDTVLATADQHNNAEIRYSQDVHRDWRECMNTSIVIRDDIFPEVQ